LLGSEEARTSISTKLKEYLDSEGVAYVPRVHTPAYTAQEIAAIAHIPGRELAKTVIVKADGKLVMAVLSANDRVDVETLQKETGSTILRLATEDEFRNSFPSCEVGAMPPFGNLFGLPTYCDRALEREHHIEFNAGTHHETIRIAFADFERLANPKLISFKRQQRRLAS
jgi:Ala-tRNA(Pro) deacylase